MTNSFTTFLLLTLVISANANPIDFITGAFDNIANLILGRKTATIERAKDELTTAREHAYKAWTESAAAVEDLGAATWDKLYEGYENAWRTYQAVKTKIADNFKKSVEEAIKDYKLAKEGVSENAKKIADFFAKYKDKAEEKSTDAYFTSLETLETAAAAARKKYSTARDVVGDLYDRVYDEAIDDYNSAVQYLHEATERAKKFAEKKTEKNFEATKQKLEEAKNKAKDHYKTSKDRLNEAKSTYENFNIEVSEFIKLHADSAKTRAEEALEALNSYKNDAKAKVNKQYHTVLASLQKANDRAVQGVKEAELNAEYLEKRLSRKISNVVEDVKLKYQHLKDEL